MAVCGVYIFIYAVYTGEYVEDFTDSTGYGGRLGNFAMDMLDLEMVIKDEENGYWLQRLKECNLTHTWPVCLIADRERLLEFYSD